MQLVARLLPLLLPLAMGIPVAQAQGVYPLEGVVTDQGERPIAGAHVFIQELRLVTATNAQGQFRFPSVPGGVYRLHISHVGYRCIHHYQVEVGGGAGAGRYVLIPDQQPIDGVTIATDRHERAKREASVPFELANRQLIEQNLGGSLMQTLEVLPGVGAMPVGQGFAKPAIRGLGFNRVVVTSQGVKLEGQQWGADHGLEVDQLAVERVEVIKGPSSLAYGSDAISGVIRILPPSIPSAHSVEANLLGLAKSVNDFLGTSARVRARGQDLYLQANITLTQLGDYRVPTDSVFYNRYRLPVHNQRLKNTAGHERNGQLTVGVVRPWGRTSVTLSNVFAKTGFFPGAHGIPSVNALRPDGSARNVALPYQQVNHLKVSSSTSVHTGHGRLGVDLGFQHNHRQEWSLFHTHYINQDPPLVNPDLELEFRLRTLSANATYSFDVNELSLTAGATAQLQANGIGGYSFLLPRYHRHMGGLFAIGRYHAGPSLTLNAGVRYDVGVMAIQQYISPFTGRAKSPHHRGRYADFTWAAGLSYLPTDRLNLKLNLGKSFRMPNASELGANGVHHGSFRYEVGDQGITSEYAYQVDLGISYSSPRVRLSASPFASYFPNFIFLSPTGSFLHPSGEPIAVTHAGQVYQYLQSAAFRAGAEAEAWVALSRNLSIAANGEWVYATDFTFPIPFTPPARAFVTLAYSAPYYWSVFHRTSLRLQLEAAAPQHRNSRNELSTPGYTLLNAFVGTTLMGPWFPISLSLQVQNILDTKHWNHVSFYRSIEIPEPGRNFQVMVSIPIERRRRPPAGGGATG